MSEPTAPSIRAAQIVMDLANTAPFLNANAAREGLAALDEVGKFFQELYAPASPAAPPEQPSVG